MSEIKNSAPTPDQLINSGINSSVELSDQELDGVSAGKDAVPPPPDSIHENSTPRAKAANKAATAIDGYIRS
jgi:hypothetical protein